MCLEQRTQERHWRGLEAAWLISNAVTSVDRAACVIQMWNSLSCQLAPMVSQFAFQEMQVPKTALSAAFLPDPISSRSPYPTTIPGTLCLLFHASTSGKLFPAYPKQEMLIPLTGLASMTIVGTSVVKREKPKSDAIVKSLILT